jgi:multiple sugar transport system permease protein
MALKNKWRCEVMDGKTQLKTQVKAKKKKFSLNEAQLGYLMIAPAILIILTIAFYPVLRSFYYSLFDLRLNNPTRNSTFLSYKIDLERYYNNYDLVKGALKRVGSSATGDSQTILKTALSDLENVDKNISSQSDVLKKSSNVKKIVDSFQAVQDDNLKYAALEKATAESAINKLDSLIKSLPSVTVPTDDKVDLDKASGLMQELKDSFVTPNFVGLNNYSYFAHDDRFWSSLGYTFQFTAISVFLELVLGIIVALVINRNFKGRGLVRAAVLIPWAIPTVVAAKMWGFIYDGQFGILSHIFEKLHLVKSSGILLTTHGGATFSIVFADVWKTVPYMALLLLAGLQSIDSTLYEASDVDGATRLQQFYKITLPLLKPTMLVALLFRTLDAFRVFDLVFVLTGGGNSTETISTYAYKTMFAQMEFGKGSTLSVVVFICVAIISIGYIKILGANVMSSER